MIPTALPRARLGRGILLAVALTALNLRTAVTGFSVLTADAAGELHFGPVVAGAVGTIITAASRWPLSPPLPWPVDSAWNVPPPLR